MRSQMAMGRVAMLADDPAVIPWTERAIGKEEVALLLGCEPRGVLERHACRDSFPKPIQDKPKMWIAKEVVAWRDTWMRKAA